MISEKVQLPLLISSDEFIRRISEFVVTDPILRRAGLKATGYFAMETQQNDRYEIFNAEPSKRFVVVTTTFGSQNGTPTLEVVSRIAPRAWMGPILFTVIALAGLLFVSATVSRIALGTWGILPWILLIAMAKRESVQIRSWLEALINGA